MATGKYLLFAALGIGAALLLSSDKAHDLKGELKEKAMKNAKKWKEKLSRVNNDGLSVKIAV